MKVQAKLLSDHYQYEVVEESSNYYIVYGTGGKVAVSKAYYEPVQEWSHLYTFYANPNGPIFELRSKEGPEGSIIIEGKVKQ